MSDETLQDLAAHLTEAHADLVIGTEIAFGELTVEIAASSAPRFFEALKSDRNCLFSTLVDITAVDHPERDRRFDLVWHLLSMYRNHRLRVRAQVRVDEVVPSICDIHAAANWYEREVFDMFGIFFSGHPDLRRILTDYGFRGHPSAQGLPDHRLHRGPL